MARTRKDNVDPAAVLRHMHEIVEEFQRIGGVTMRQAYYQLVQHRQAMPSGKKYYNFLVNMITEARLSGTFPVDGLVDRGREARPGTVALNQDSLADAIDSCRREIQQQPLWLARGRWLGQKKIVSVWVEKDAMAGVFERPCNRLGVPWYVCKGYSSVPGLYEWLKCVLEAYNVRQRAIENNLMATESWPVFEEFLILYFGDHDADGWDIQRSARANLLRMFETLCNQRDELTYCVRELSPYNPELWFANYLRFHRVALTMEQIREGNLPPYVKDKPASNSPRYAKYVREHHTRDSWEIDALRPDGLQDLIRDSVQAEFDEDIHRGNTHLIGDLREQLKDTLRDREWMDETLAGIED